MTDLKEILKNAVKKLKRAQVVEPESSRRIRKVQEAAKQASEEVKAGRV
jgi:hypothetical protein